MPPSSSYTSLVAPGELLVFSFTQSLRQSWTMFASEYGSPLTRTSQLRKQKSSLISVILYRSTETVPTPFRRSRLAYFKLIPGRHDKAILRSMQLVAHRKTLRFTPSETVFGSLNFFVTLLHFLTAPSGMWWNCDRMLTGLLTHANPHENVNGHERQRVT